MTDDRLTYHRYLEPLALYDGVFLKEKDTSYGASWKKSGGRSAWFMMVRMMDRLAEMMKPPAMPPELTPEILKSMIEGPNELSGSAAVYLAKSIEADDIFTKIIARPGGEDGSVLAVLRDLRRYCLLVEAEMVERGVVAAPPEDSRPAVQTPPDPPPVPLEDSNKHAERAASGGSGLRPPGWEPVGEI